MPVNVCATVRPGTLTTLKIACSIDALPGPSASSIHTASRPAGALLCAGAAANPAPLEGHLARGARAGSHALAVADHVGRGAATCAWSQWRKRRVAVQTSESARVSVDARWYAVIGEGAVAVEPSTFLDLK